MQFVEKFATIPIYPYPFFEDFSAYFQNATRKKRKATASHTGSMRRSKLEATKEARSRHFKRSQIRVDRLGRLGCLRHARSTDDALASLRCVRSAGQLHGSPINFCTGIDTSSHRGRRPHQSVLHLAVRACLNDNGRHHPASSPTPLATTCDLASVPAHLAALRAHYSRQHRNASDNERAASAAAALRPRTF